VTCLWGVAPCGWWGWGSGAAAHVVGGGGVDPEEVVGRLILLTVLVLFLSCVCVFGCVTCFSLTPTSGTRVSQPRPAPSGGGSTQNSGPGSGLVLLLVFTIGFLVNPSTYTMVY